MYNRVSRIDRVRVEVVKRLHPKEDVAELREDEVRQRFGKDIGRHIVGADVFHRKDAALIEVAHVCDPALKMAGATGCAMVKGYGCPGPCWQDPGTPGQPLSSKMRSSCSETCPSGRFVPNGFPVALSRALSGIQGIWPAMPDSASEAPR